MWWLPRVIDLTGIDLFHATFNIMPAGLRMPCVTTVHDVMWLTHPDWCNPHPYGLLERAFYSHGIKRALNRSAAIATVSRASRDEIIAWAPHARAKTFVTSSGVSADFHPTEPDPASFVSLGLPRDKRFVLVVGQYAPYKNHDGAVRAFAEAFRERHDIDLVLLQRMGKGAQRLMPLTEELGLTGRIHILPPVDRNELMQLYSSAAALLHPSLCEGFGNPLAEAMACGCPIVTSNLSAMPEVTGGAAVLVNPRDPVAIAAGLREVVDNPPKAAAMRRAGLLRASELTWSAFAAANIEIYRRVLASA
jgi:glycosyltransferase involved in cell wall biosynthesis